MPIRSLTAPLAVTAMLALCAIAYAATVTRFNPRQTNQAYPSAGHARDDATRHAELLALEPQSGLVLIRRRDTRDGGRHFRYQQTYRGVPIFAKHVIVIETRDGRIRSVWGSKVAGLASDIRSTHPRISASRAISIGKTIALRGKPSSVVTRDEKSELMIHLDDNHRAVLVYVVSFFAAAPDGAHTAVPEVIVDANTGAVIDWWDRLGSSPVSGVPARAPRPAVTPGRRDDRYGSRIRPPRMTTSEA